MEDKKQHILKNVGKLYLKFGIRGVTMDDVAQELGISKKTLYQFFNDKEDLVTQVVEYYMNNPMFNLSGERNGNAIDNIFAIRNHVVQMIHHINNNLEFDLKRLYPHLHKKVYSFKRQRIFNDTIANVEKGIAEGLYRAELEPEFIARLQVGRMLYTFNPDNEVFETSDLSSINLFDKAIDYHMHAICTPEGIEYYREQLLKHQNEQQNETLH